MFYGVVIWDHLLILAQMICLQCLYYLGAALSFLVGARASRMSLVYFFDFVTVTTSSITGCSAIAAVLLSFIAGSVYMFYLIETAKKRLYFSATLYIIHLFVCTIPGGWLFSITWWVVNVTGFAVMALLGEYLCSRQELREIRIMRMRKFVVFHCIKRVDQIESTMRKK